MSSPPASPGVRDVPFATAIRESNSERSPTVAAATNLRVALAKSDRQTFYCGYLFDFCTVGGTTGHQVHVPTP
jgi:hypothetical protein